MDEKNIDEQKKNYITSNVLHCRPGLKYMTPHKNIVTSNQELLENNVSTAELQLALIHGALDAQDGSRFSSLIRCWYLQFQCNNCTAYDVLYQMKSLVEDTGVEEWPDFGYNTWLMR